MAVRRSPLAGSGIYSDRPKKADCCSCSRSCSEERLVSEARKVSPVGCGGGEAGNAVCMACRSTEPRGGEENGTGTTRWPGYDAELLDSPDDVRECDIVLILLDTVLVLGWVDETLERDGSDGEVGVTLPDTLPVDREGERERFGGDMVRAVDVAWCRSVGGAVAMALAFARLAAMAAAKLLFFACGVAG